VSENSIGDSLSSMVARTIPWPLSDPVAALFRPEQERLARLQVAGALQSVGRQSAAPEAPPIAQKARVLADQPAGVSAEELVAAGRQAAPGAKLERQVARVVEHELPLHEIAGGRIQAHPDALAIAQRVGHHAPLPPEAVRGPGVSQ
jgi:hypothetical protein